MAWTVVLLIAIKLVAGAFCHVSPQGRATSYVDDVLGTIMICTSGAHATTDETPPAPVNTSECPACALSALLLFTVVLALLGLIAPPPASSIPRRPRVSALALHVASGAVRSRAPPLLS